MKRLALTLLLGVTALLTSALAPAGVAGAYPPPNTSNITTNVPSVPTNGVFTSTVSNCLPGETVVFEFQGVEVTATCDPTTLQATAEFRAPAAAGSYQVCAELTGIGAIAGNAPRPSTICTSIGVLAETVTQPTTPGGGLPATGSSGLGTTTTSALVLVGAGGLLLLVAQVRRRRTASATAA